VAAAELALVALLSVPATVVVGFAAAAATLVVLSAVLVRSLALGLSVPCRCFGVSRRPVGRAHVGRNVVLVLVAVAGGVAASTTDAAVRPTGFALGVFFAAMGLLGVVFFDDLIALFPASGR
jgi:hypothetical protein